MSSAIYRLCQPNAQYYVCRRLLLLSIFHCFVLESSSKVDMLTIYFRPVWSYAFTILAGTALVAVKQKDNIFVAAYVHSY